MRLTDLIARYKAYGMRSMLYYQLLNSFLILLIFLRDYQLTVIERGLIILFAVIGVWVIGRYDRKFKILEKEQSYFNSENKEVQEMLARLKNIEDKLTRRSKNDNLCRNTSLRK